MDVSGIHQLNYKRAHTTFFFGCQVRGWLGDLDVAFEGPRERF